MDGYVFRPVLVDCRGEWLASNLWTVEWDQANLAYLISMVVAVPLYMILAGTDAGAIAKDLAPETAGLRSPYYNLVARNPKAMRKGLIVRIIFLAVLLAGVWVWPKGWLSVAFLQFYFFMAALDYLPSSIESALKTNSWMEQTSVGSQEGKQGLNAAQIGLSKLPFSKPPTQPAEDFPALVGQLFEAAGWAVTYKPRTQDPSIDPLLENVDLLAQCEQRSVIVEVINTPQAAPPVDLNRPSALKQAVWVLAEARGLDPEFVSASLVFIDAKPDARLEKICGRLGISLDSLDSTDIRRTLDLVAGDARRMAAETLLGLPKPAVV